MNLWRDQPAGGLETVRSAFPSLPNYRKEDKRFPLQKRLDGYHPRVRALCRHLLRTGIVKLQPHDMFTFPRWTTPIYVDLRLSLADPDARAAIANALADTIRAHFVVGRDPRAPPITIAGVASGAISHATLAADRLGLPAAYVRPAPKDHGMGKQVEGSVESGTPCVVVEDVLGTGGSVRNAVETLQKHGANVLGVCAVFSYHFGTLFKTVDGMNMPFVALTDMTAVVDCAFESDVIDQDGHRAIGDWYASRAHRPF